MEFAAADERVNGIWFCPGRGKGFTPSIRSFFSLSFYIWFSSFSEAGGMYEGILVGAVLAVIRSFWILLGVGQFLQVQCLVVDHETDTSERAFGGFGDFHFESTFP